MTDTVMALFLLCILIFLLGRKIGQMGYKRTLQNDITRNGCFMLGNGFYRAIKLSKADTIPELTEPIMPEVVKKPIRRRNVTRATH